MSVNHLKTYGQPKDETLFILRDPDQLYTHSEVVDLLELAEKMGFSLEKGSDLERLTVRELDILLHRKN
jgi:hypothetical protein